MLTNHELSELKIQISKTKNFTKINNISLDIPYLIDEVIALRKLVKSFKDSYNKSHNSKDITNINN